VGPERGSIPAKLPGFGAASQVPLETYYPPQVEPGDGRSRAELEGKPLLPTMNLGDYIAQPPMMLTTLEGARLPLDSKRFEGSDPKAPISVIRVRVAGVTGPDPRCPGSG
jgi:putative ABC transport system permease protein